MTDICRKPTFRGSYRGPGLRVASAAWPVTALGPGRRLSLWLTGCRRRCPGCISPELQPFGAGKNIGMLNLFTYIKGLPEWLDGITVTGGEPFLQAGALASLLEGVSRLRPNWNTLVYSGFSLEELRRKGPGAKRALRLTDILIDGPYMAEAPSEHNLMGSSNQRIRLLTQAGKRLRHRLNGAGGDRPELGLGRAGKDMLIGVLTRQKRLEHKKILGIKRAYGREHS